MGKKSLRKGLKLMHWLLIAILVIPAIEIGVFVWIGGMTGPWFIIAMIILTGIIGVTLAKQQGIETWKRARLAMNIGQVPGREILDGICILFGAIFLMTPGFITDIIGFILLLPWSRNVVTHCLQKILKRKFDRRVYTIRK